MLGASPLGRLPLGQSTIEDATDTTAPVITLLGNATVTITAGDTYVDAGATASDDTDGDITTNIVTVNPVDANTPDTYIITYNVSDAASNSAIEVTRTVIVEAFVDTTAPVITLNGTSPTTIAQDIAYVDRGATAVDNRDGDITGNIVATGSVNTAVPGEYSITYNVDDSAGNSATPVVRVVNVVESSEVPITDREPVRRVASYLRTQGYTGSDNDVIMQWLGVEGYAGGYNDKWNAYLSVQGFTTGGLQDKLSQWKNE